MDTIVCSQCGAEIAGKGIDFRSRHFCSDECCEEFDVVLAEGSEPGDMELVVADVDDDVDNDLGYRSGGEGEEHGDGEVMDDEFDIKTDDF